MKFNINNQSISIFFIIFAILSFFCGFYFDEISIGAGGYKGDFKFVQKSIKLFSENSIKDSIILFSESSNRPPLIYILHKILNPFSDSDIDFRRVVFFISLSVPCLLFLCLKEKFKHKDNILLLLLTSIIFFNPFFRNSSFWGLEENYAFVALLVSILFLLKLENLKKNDHKIYIEIFILTFSSSLCIYFDQKFLIIPLICFLKIMRSNHLMKFKIFTIVLYTLFSIPFLYLINIWGSIFPSNIYHIGKQFYFHHLGFAITMIAFIIFPLILIIKENLISKLFDFSKDYFNLFNLIIILLYIIFLAFFYDNSFINNKLDGGGIIKKIALVLFDDITIRKTFIFLSFFLSWNFIVLIFGKNIQNLSIIVYFLLISLITKPFYQEYFDPLLFFLIIFILNFKFELKYKNIFFLYSFYLIFLITTNFYYNNLI